MTSFPKNGPPVFSRSSLRSEVKLDKGESSSHPPTTTASRPLGVDLDNSSLSVEDPEVVTDIISRLREHAKPITSKTIEPLLANTNVLETDEPTARLSALIKPESPGRAYVLLS